VVQKFWLLGAQRLSSVKLFGDLARDAKNYIDLSRYPPCQGRGVTVGLADEVLALHNAILRVMIVETRAGELHVVDEVSRRNPALFNSVSQQANDILLVAPTMILGAAAKIGNLQGTGELSLVGMLYEEQGLICAPVNEATYMLVTTPRESLHGVMETFERTLPRVLDKRSPISRSLAINSAAEADQTVRAFFANIGLCDPTSIRMQDATLNPNDHSWQISGVYRPAHALLSKRYIVRLDARTGAVTTFQG